MIRFRILLAICAALALPLISAGGQPAPAASDQAGAARMAPAVGPWRVEFANGVVEACSVRKDGTIFVVEPKRNSGGKVTIQDGVFMNIFDDDRVERWTPVGQRMIVEHWFPASQFPAGHSVLGIAERSALSPEIALLWQAIEQMHQRIRDLKASRPTEQ